MIVDQVAWLEGTKKAKHQYKDHCNRKALGGIIRRRNVLRAGHKYNQSQKQTKWGGSHTSEIKLGKGGMTYTVYIHIRDKKKGGIE